MFIFTQSEADAWRVFIPSSLNETIHRHMKGHSTQGGHDQIQWFNHIECKGYEFKNISHASDVVRGCSLYY